MKKLIVLILLIFTSNLANGSEKPSGKELLRNNKYKRFLIATKYINKGKTHLYKKKYLWALQAFRKSVDYYPTAAAYTNMAIIYRYFNDFPKMKYCLKMAGRLGDRKAERIWRLLKRGI